MPYFTAFWDVSLIEAQNWLARYPAEDSANPFYECLDTQEIGNRAGQFPPIWLYRVTVGCYSALGLILVTVVSVNSYRGFLVGPLSRSLRLFIGFFSTRSLPLTSQLIR